MKGKSAHICLLDAWNFHYFLTALSSLVGFRSTCIVSSRSQFADVVPLWMHPYKWEQCETEKSHLLQWDMDWQRAHETGRPSFVILCHSFPTLPRLASAQSGVLIQGCWWWRTRGGGLTREGPAAAWNPACPPSLMGHIAPSTVRWRRRSWPAPLAPVCSITHTCTLMGTWVVRVQINAESAYVMMTMMMQICDIKCKCIASEKKLRKRVWNEQ